MTLLFALAYLPSLTQPLPDSATKGNASPTSHLISTGEISYRIHRAGHYKYETVGLSHHLSSDKRRGFNHDFSLFFSLDFDYPLYESKGKWSYAMPIGTQWEVSPIAGALLELHRAGEWGGGIVQMSKGQLFGGFSTFYNEPGVVRIGVEGLLFKDMGVACTVIRESNFEGYKLGWPLGAKGTVYASFPNTDETSIGLSMGGLSTLSGSYWGLEFNAHFSWRY